MLASIHNKKCKIFDKRQTLKRVALIKGKLIHRLSIDLDRILYIYFWKISLTERLTLLNLDTSVL